MLKQSPEMRYVAYFPQNRNRMQDFLKVYALVEVSCDFFSPFVPSIIHPSIAIWNRKTVEDFEQENWTLGET